MFSIIWYNFVVVCCFEWSVLKWTFSGIFDLFFFFNVPLTYICSGWLRIQSMSWSGLSLPVQMLWIAVNNGNLFDSEKGENNERKKHWIWKSVAFLMGMVVNYLSSIFLFASMKLTSLAVGGPCNFWPFNISCSSCSIVLPLVTNASDTLRLRPPVFQVLERDRNGESEALKYQILPKNKQTKSTNRSTNRNKLWLNQRHRNSRRMLPICYLDRRLLRIWSFP